MGIIADISGLGRKATAFLGKSSGMLIDGKIVEAAIGKRFAVFNPATGRQIATAPEADAEDVNVAVAAARRAFEGSWRRTKPHERARLIWRLADLIEQNAEEFAQLETLDNGKPLSVSRAVDIPHAIDVLQYAGGWATKITGSTSTLSAPGQYMAYTLREPIGVVGQIIPWNFPLVMIAWKIAPALAAGCTIVLKPAEQTPLSALRLSELILEAGFPPGVINIVTGFGDPAGAAISGHPGIDKVSFTGSTEVGKIIVDAARQNLKKVTLELGGKSPMIVFPDADLDVVGVGTAAAIFSNQGQICSAGSVLYAHNKVLDDVVERISRKAKSIKVGPGLDVSNEMGPLVSKEQFDRVTGYIDIGKSEGASVATGGGSYGEGYFVEPTVLVNVSSEMRVVREEIFGPVLCVQGFDDGDIEAIAARANDTVYGLGASVWTRDISVAHRLAGLIRAGTVWINCHGVIDPAMPFGGYKQSGWGREHGDEVFHSYTEVKSVIAAL